MKTPYLTDKGVRVCRPHNPYVPGELPTDWSVKFDPTDYGVKVTLYCKGEEACLTDLGPVGGFGRTFRLYGVPQVTQKVRTDPEAQAIKAYEADADRARRETDEMALMAATKEAGRQKEAFKESLKSNVGKVTDAERVELLQKVLNMSDEELGLFLEILKGKR